MRIALINSGLGLLAAAAAVHRLRPDADLVLAMDPDGMPWGPRTPDDIAQRSLAAARAAAAFGPDVIVFACNTGTVHAIGALRAEFEPGIPIVGTVPAIKPAAAACDSVAIWATVATTASAYQRQLIADFAGSAQVTAVACPGLADAVDAGDEAGTRAAVAGAAARTPAGCRAVVLGCTEYELAASEIAAALPHVTLFGSAAAVAAQALRRAEAVRPGGPPVTRTKAAETLTPGAPSARPPSSGTRPPGPTALSAPDRAGTVRVILSGRLAELPAAALRYPEGRLLAGLAGDRRAGDGPADDLPADPLSADPRPADRLRAGRPPDRRADERPPDRRPDDPAEPEAGRAPDRPAGGAAGDSAAEDGAPDPARSVTA
jgi:glutamate racemase